MRTVIELVKALKGTPLPVILVLAGILFILLSVAGRISGKIRVQKGRQKQAGAIGFVLLLLGSVIYFLPSPYLQSPQPPPPSSDAKSSSLEDKLADLNQMQESGIEMLTLKRLDLANQQFEKAANFLQELQTQAPSNIQVMEQSGYLHKNWALVCQELSRAEEFQKHLAQSEKAFKEVIERQPSASSYNGLGNVYYLRGDLVNAEKQTRAALQLTPEYQETQHDLQLILRAKTNN